MSTIVAKTGQPTVPYRTYFSSPRPACRARRRRSPRVHLFKLSINTRELHHIQGHPGSQPHFIHSSGHCCIFLVCSSCVLCLLAPLALLAFLVVGWLAWVSLSLALWAGGLCACALGFCGVVFRISVHQPFFPTSSVRLWGSWTWQRRTTASARGDSLAGTRRITHTRKRSRKGPASTSLKVRSKKQQIHLSTACKPNVTLCLQTTHQNHTKRKQDCLSSRQEKAQMAREQLRRDQHRRHHHRHHHRRHHTYAMGYRTQQPHPT